LNKGGCDALGSPSLVITVDDGEPRSHLAN
jgi:hypothetical protein